MAVVLLIITTTLFTVYYLDVTNIIRHISYQVIGYIKEKKSFKKIPFLNLDIGYTDPFIDTLNNEVRVFVTTSVEAVNKNQEKVLKASLKSLSDISLCYLEESKNIESTDDRFLNNFE